MGRTSQYHRHVAVLGLVGTATLSAVSVVLQPDLSGSSADQLASLDAAGARSTISAVTFVVSQLPFIAAVLAIAHLARPRAPRAADIGATLGVAGAFGHSVFGGISLVYLEMATDPAHRSVYVTLMDRIGSSPVMLFALVGLAGTVLGVLVLGIGLWRSGVVERWIPAAMWAFLVVEFVGTAISPAASYLSATLFVLTLGALAVVARRRSVWGGESAPAPREAMPA